MSIENQPKSPPKDSRATRLTTDQSFDMLYIKPKDLSQGSKFKFRYGTTINEYTGRDSDNKVMYRNLLTNRVSKIDTKKKPDLKVINISHLFTPSEPENCPF